MPRTGLSQEDVIEAIEALVGSNQSLTSASIRAYLGRGSLSTIQKHFKRWRDQAFQKWACMPEASTLEPDMIQPDFKALDQLKAKLLEKEAYQKTLSGELIKKAQENQKLLLENEKLNQNLFELTASYKQLSIADQGLKRQYADLKAERESTLDRILTDKNEQIQRLQVELKTVHEKNLEAIKAIGRQGDDLLISEKAKTIYLKDDLTACREKLKILEEELKKATEVIEPLRKTIKKQQAFIQKFVSWEQFKNQTDQQKIETFLKDETHDN